MEDTLLQHTHIDVIERNMQVVDVSDGITLKAGQVYCFSGNVVMIQKETGLRQYVKAYTPSFLLTNHTVARYNYADVTRQHSYAEFLIGDTIYTIEDNVLYWHALDRMKLYVSKE